MPGAMGRGVRGSLQLYSGRMGLGRSVCMLVHLQRGKGRCVGEKEKAKRVQKPP